MSIGGLWMNGTIDVNGINLKNRWDLINIDLICFAVHKRDQTTRSFEHEQDCASNSELCFRSEVAFKPIQKFVIHFFS